MCIQYVDILLSCRKYSYIDGILPKGLYLPYVSMAGRSLLAGYHRYQKMIERERTDVSNTRIFNIVRKSPLSMHGWNICLELQSLSVNSKRNVFFHTLKKICVIEMSNFKSFPFHAARIIKSIHAINSPLQSIYWFIYASINWPLLVQIMSCCLFGTKLLTGLLSIWKDFWQIAIKSVS